MSDPAVAIDPKQSTDELEIADILSEHKIPRSVVDDLKSKNAKALYVYRDQPVIFRLPSRDEFDRLGRKSSAEKVSAVADLVRRHVVYPDADAYAALLEEYPVLFGAISDAMADIAKGKKSAEAKKL